MNVAPLVGETCGENLPEFVASLFIGVVGVERVGGSGLDTDLRAETPDLTIGRREVVEGFFDPRIIKLEYKGLPESSHKQS
jgi:hypothetical protein